MTKWTSEEVRKTINECEWSGGHGGPPAPTSKMCKMLEAYAELLEKAEKATVSMYIGNGIAHKWTSFDFLIAKIKELKESNPLIISEPDKLNALYKAAGLE